MTFDDFKTHCEDIATEESNENWNQKETLDRIAASIGSVAIDFAYDADNEVRELNV